MYSRFASEQGLSGHRPATIWVYVPQQYDASQPACVYVNQDNVAVQGPRGV